MYHVALIALLATALQKELAAAVTLADARIDDARRSIRIGLLLSIRIARSLVSIGIRRLLVPQVLFLLVQAFVRDNESFLFHFQAQRDRSLMLQKDILVNHTLFNVLLRNSGPGKRLHCSCILQTENRKRAPGNSVRLLAPSQFFVNHARRRRAKCELASSIETKQADCT
jgi:hypothetical protein